MNINVSGEMEEYLKEKVESGEYESFEQVVEDALRVFRDAQLVYSIPADDLNAALEPAIEQINRGEGRSLEDVLKDLEEFKRQHRKSEKTA